MEDLATFPWPWLYKKYLALVNQEQQDNGYQHDWRREYEQANRKYQINKWL
jgi:hypothetical protein